MGKCIRFLCAALMLSMLFSLASCGYGETEKTPIDSGTSSESQTDEGTDNEVSETDEDTGTDVAAAAVEETVMWDNEDIKITAQSLTSDNSFYILHLQIENKTAEDLYMMASRCAVNGFVVEPVMSVDVPANSTTEGEVKFYRKDVYRDVVADIEIRFHYNSSNYAISGKTERVKLETSAAASFDYSYDDSGTLLYEENGIKIVCQGFNDDGNPIIYLYSTGELSEGCVVEEYEIYINGKKSRADFCNWVFPHTRNVAEMNISDKDIDGNELGNVESIQVSFKISKENMADPHPVKTQLLEIPVK